MQKRHPKCPCANECACVGTIGKWHAILPFHGRCTHINPLKYDVSMHNRSSHSLISISFNLFVWLFLSLCIYLDCGAVFVHAFCHFHFLFLHRAAWHQLAHMATQCQSIRHRVLSRRTNDDYDRRKLFFYFFIFSRVNAINPHRFVASIVFTDDFIYFRISCTSWTHWTYA